MGRPQMALIGEKFPSQFRDKSLVDFPHEAKSKTSHQKRLPDGIPGFKGEVFQLILGKPYQKAGR